MERKSFKNNLYVENTLSSNVLLAGQDEKRRIKFFSFLIESSLIHCDSDFYVFGATPKEINYLDKINKIQNKDTFSKEAFEDTIKSIYEEAIRRLVLLEKENIDSISRYNLINNTKIKRILFTCFELTEFQTNDKLVEQMLYFLMKISHKVNIYFMFTSSIMKSFKPQMVENSHQLMCLKLNKAYEYKRFFHTSKIPLEDDSSKIAIKYNFSSNDKSPYHLLNIGQNLFSEHYAL